MRASLLCAALAAVFPASAAVVISQVYGGGGNSGAQLKNDFIELHNNGSTDEMLGGWSVQYASAAGSSWQVSPLPAGTVLAPGRYLLIRQAAQGGGTVEVVADVTPATPIAMSASSGKVALSRAAVPLTGTAPSGGTLVDIVSYGSANATEGTPAGGLSATTAALRRNGGCDDSNDNSADFSVAAPAPRNAGTPARLCDGSGGGDGGTTPPPMAAAIYTIQGAGTTSPLAGKTVVTTGVVTRRNSNGFFVQDAVGDNDPATSDGLFVFTGSTAYPAVAVGNLVEVTGTVTEFNTGAAGNAVTAARPVTQLSNVTGVVQRGSGYSIAPVVVTLPEAVDDELERHEGMLVTLTGPFTIAQNFFQGRYGQLTLAVGGRLETPTNRYRPGPQAQALADLNSRRRIVLDDGSSLQNPNPTPYLGADTLPRAGDLAGSITGVIDYGLATSSNADAGDYKIHPTVAPVFSTANPRSAAPATVGGNVTVASFNVLNYFTTFTDGRTADGRSGQGCSLGTSVSAANCRGANSLAEFQRQQAKIVAAMAAIPADVFGLMEIQNNGNVAAQNLADALNARVGAGSYAVAALPAASTGTDAIRVALLYRPARLSPVAAPVSDADPVNNRPTLAQTFAAANGERFTVFVNHFKSKGSCPSAGDADAAGNTDAGDGQGCWNAQRLQQAQRLRSFVAQQQAAAGASDVLLIGDFNAYAQEDPIHALTASGFVDQSGRFESFGYSYVFDGAAGRLDHAITGGNLSGRITGVTHWHINADETALADYNQEFKAPAICNGALCPADPYAPTPYRSSDHDPVLVGIDLTKTVTGGTGRDTLVGTPGDDRLVGGAGPDVLTGGAGRNVFAYQSMRDAGDTVTDFVPGKDRIDLAALLASIGIDPARGGSAGVVRLVASGSDTLLQIDVDGSAGPIAPRTLATLRGVSPTTVSLSRDLGVQ